MNVQKLAVFGLSLLVSLVACAPPKQEQTPPPEETVVPKVVTAEGAAGTDASPFSGLNATILSPVNGGSYLASESVRFQARFTNAADQLVAPKTVSWTIDTAVATSGSTNPFDAPAAPAGSYLADVSATALALTVEASVGYTVLDAGESLGVRFVEPRAGAVFVRQSGALAGGLQVTVEVAGAPAVLASAMTYAFTLADGSTLTSAPIFQNNAARLQTVLRATGGAAPPAGEQTIKVEVRDPMGTRTGQATVKVVLIEANTAPVVSITEPSRNATLAGVLIGVGGELNLTGTMTEADTARALLPDNDLVPVWTDSIAGRLGTGLTAKLPASATGAAGKHVVTFCAKDHAGAKTCDTLSVFVSNAADAAAAKAALFQGYSDVTLGLPIGNAGLLRIYTDPAGLMWLGAEAGFAVRDASGATMTMTGLPNTLGPANVANANPQVAAIRDVLVSGSQVFFATSKGAHRCDFSSAATALTFTGCIRLDATGGGTQPDTYTNAASLRSLELHSGKLYFAGDDGISVSSAPTAATPVIDIYYRQGQHFSSTRGADDIIFVGDAPWVVLHDAAGNANQGLCLAAGSAQNPFTGGTANVTCNPGPSSLQNVIPERIVSLANVSGTFYLGTDRGLVRWEQTSELTVVFDQNGGLAHERVNAVVLRNGIVWIGTNNGLSRLDPGTGGITNFSAADFGAQNAKVSALGVDQSGALVVQMGNGTTSFFRYSGG